MIPDDSEAELEMVHLVGEVEPGFAFRHGGKRYGGFTSQAHADFVKALLIREENSADQGAFAPVRQRPA